jgi:hypothetical protein
MNYLYHTVCSKGPLLQTGDFKFLYSPKTNATDIGVYPVAPGLLLGER